LHDLGEAAEFAQIGLDDAYDATDLVYPLRGLFQIVAGAGQNGNAGACAGEFEGCGPPDATSRSGNQGDLPTQNRHGLIVSPGRETAGSILQREDADR
jgi:hypothetical protein